MEPILMYGVPAGSSMGLIAAFEWLGRPYRLCRVDMLGEMRKPDYAKVNPRHETPVLITDEGEPLTETMAIGRWIEARDTERRVSFDPLSAEADYMHQFMAYVNTGFAGAFSALWTAMEMDTPDPAYEAALRRFGHAAVIERHDKLEAMLGDGPYAIGDRPTLADAVLVGVARWTEIHGVDRSARWPRLGRLRQRVEASPAVLFALATERGERSIGSGACVGEVELSDLIARYGDRIRK